jgi:hypothetical protein
MYITDGRPGMAQNRNCDLARRRRRGAVKTGDGSMDDNEALAEVRARAQAAMSRARLASDPAVKKEWTELANAWSVLLGQLEAVARETIARKRGGPKKSGPGRGFGPAKD